MTRKKFGLPDLRAKKEHDETITMVTAYDYPSALLADRAEIDMILVGDSLGMVVLGLESTVAVTMEEMLHHCRAVSRGARHAYLVGDMPFLSYQVSQSEAVYNAGRFLKESGMDSVKLEGGRRVAETVAAIVGAGIPVMGHIGLTPQTISMLGGFRVQGRDVASAVDLVDDALALEQAGCYALVLEAIPDTVARAISGNLSIPTIGIGAGPDCDGQVLVYHDLLGLFDRFTPTFVKKYSDLNDEILKALVAYREDVTHRRFPGNEHSYKMDESARDEFDKLLQQRGLSDKKA